MTAARKLPDQNPTRMPRSERVDALPLMKRRVMEFFDAQGLRLDANEGLAVARSLLSVQAAPIWKGYLTPVWRSIFPVDGTVPEWADAHAYEEIDQIGDAEIVDDYADDAPMVDVKSTETLGKVVPVRVAYGYSVNDLRKAARMLMPLDTAKALTARDVYERKLERLVARGSSAHDILGITNAANITNATAASTAWASATAAQIQADIERLINAIPTASAGQHETNLVLFPQAAWQIVRTKRLVDNFQTTILQYFREVFPEITFGKWQRLNLADAGSDGPRVMAFERAPQNASVVVPMDFMQHPAQQRSLMFRVECEGRFGGWKIPKPKSIAYMDDV